MEKVNFLVRHIPKKYKEEIAAFAILSGKTQNEIFLQLIKDSWANQFALRHTVLENNKRSTLKQIQQYEGEGVAAIYYENSNLKTLDEFRQKQPQQQVILQHIPPKAS